MSRVKPSPPPSSYLQRLPKGDRDALLSLIRSQNPPSLPALPPSPPPFPLSPHSPRRPSTASARSSVSSMPQALDSDAYSTAYALPFKQQQQHQQHQHQQQQHQQQHAHHRNIPNISSDATHTATSPPPSPSCGDLHLRQQLAAVTMALDALVSRHEKALGDISERDGIIQQQQQQLQRASENIESLRQLYVAAHTGGSAATESSVRDVWSAVDLNGLGAVEAKSSTGSGRFSKGGGVTHTMNEIKALEGRVHKAESETRRVQHLLFELENECSGLRISMGTLRRERDRAVTALEQHSHQSQAREAALQQRLQKMEAIAEKHQTWANALERKLLKDCRTSTNASSIESFAAAKQCRPFSKSLDAAPWTNIQRALEEVDDN